MNQENYHVNKHKTILNIHGICYPKIEIYRLTCIEKSPLAQRKIGLIRQVTS